MYEERSVNTISYILCLYDVVDVHVVWFSDVKCLCFKAYFATQTHATVVLMLFGVSWHYFVHTC